MEYTSKGAQLLKSVIDRQIANGAEVIVEVPARERVAIVRVEMLRGAKSAVLDLRDRNGTLRRSVHINAGKSISHRKLTERAIAYANTQSEAFEYVPAWDMSYSWTPGEVLPV